MTTLTLNLERPGIQALAEAKGQTPEQYLSERIEEVLSSYDAALIESIKKENEPFFELAARLPLNRQDALRSYVQTVAREEGIIE